MPYKMIQAVQENGPSRDRLDDMIEVILTVALCAVVYTVCWILFI